MLDYLRSLLKSSRNEHTDNLVKLLPHPDEIERRYLAGEFLFYSTGGGGELSENFYGETWIPEGWMRERFVSLGFSRCGEIAHQSQTRPLWALPHKMHTVLGTNTYKVYRKHHDSNNYSFLVVFCY
jgi:hypothetical protein